MYEAKYKQLKEYYTELNKEGYEASDLFLCLNDGFWGEYNCNQNGYKNATERTPVPKEKVCESCQQTIPLPEMESK